jgi:hypothetical protein
MEMWRGSAGRGGHVPAEEPVVGDQRGLADERRYATKIREWLTTRGGRPDSSQGMIADARRTSSLRAPAR